MSAEPTTDYISVTIAAYRASAHMTERQLSYGASDTRELARFGPDALEVGYQRPV